MKTFILCASLSIPIYGFSAPLKIELPPEDTTFKRVPGVEIAMQNCLVCHSSEYITTQPPLSRTAWKASVEKMKGKFGAQISVDQFDALVDYLSGAYGEKVP